MRKQRRSQLRCNCTADQRLCLCNIASSRSLLSKSNIFKPLTIFCGCTVRFVSGLVGNAEDRFSRNAAHIKRTRIKLPLVTFQHIYRNDNRITHFQTNHIILIETNMKLNAWLFINIISDFNMIQSSLKLTPTY